jgi:hypothetical protein
VFVACSGVVFLQQCVLKYYRRRHKRCRSTKVCLKRDGASVLLPVTCCDCLKNGSGRGVLPGRQLRPDQLVVEEDFISPGRLARIGPKVTRHDFDVRKHLLD